MKRTGLFAKIFIYTFSIFSVLVICLHLAIYFLFPSTYLSHRQETIGQKATAIAQSLEGKDRQSIEQVLDLYSQTSDIKGTVKGEMTEDKLEVKDSLPLDTDRQTTSLFIEEREVKTQDGGTMILQFLASMDLQKEAEQISLQFLPYTLLASFLIFPLGGLHLRSDYCCTDFGNQAGDSSDDVPGCPSAIARGF